MLKIGRKIQDSRGDTIVEVLFAMAIFSLVAVGSLSIMNKSTLTAQRALEIDLVRQEMNAQAETLRFLNASYIADYPSTSGVQSAQWSNMSAYFNSEKSSDSSINTCPLTVSDLPKNSFILNTHTATFVALTSSNYKAADTYSQTVYNGDDLSQASGIWIEAVKSSSSEGNATYVDFYIHSCWDSMGQSAPVTLDTIVRLYEPLG